jgi:arylsulfate sulfotransferase
MKKILRLSLLVLLLLSACKKEDINLPEPEKITSITDAIIALNAVQLDNNLITNIATIDTCHLVTFEDDITLEILATLIDSFSIDEDLWTVTFYYNDGQEQTLSYLGNENGLTIVHTQLNPYLICPLVAEVEVKAIVKSFYKVRVIGKNGIHSDVENSTLYWTDSIKLAILGLYAAENNTIEISLLDVNGNVRVTKTINIITEPLSFFMPDINVNTSNSAKMAEGFTLINYISGIPRTPFFIDDFGDIRWYMDVENHIPELAELNYGNGLIRLRNGNFAFSDVNTHQIYEMSVLGEMLNQWSLGDHFFHHALEEKPNGNFILTSTKSGSIHLSGLIAIEDYMVEIDRNSGNIVREWDMKESLDESRVALGRFANASFEDWFHDNGLAYDANDGTIVVSGRTQGLVKVTDNNEVVWVIATHRDWDSSRLGDDMQQYLLQPLDKNGIAISDTGVINGSSNHPDFEWPWYQHAPFIMPNGNIMCFDNGDNRNYTGIEKYSRAVEYKIDEENMTIQQVWSYGKERGINAFARVVSDVDYISSANHVLFIPGFQVINSNGIGSKVIEIDYNTMQVVFEVEISAMGGAMVHQAERLSLYP